jgi:hypothetical protein
MATAVTGDPPLVAKPALTTERNSTLSRLFPDLVGPPTAEPAAPDASVVSPENDATMPTPAAADQPPSEPPTDGDAATADSEPTTPEPEDDRENDE